MSVFCSFTALNVGICASCGTKWCNETGQAGASWLASEDIAATLYADVFDTASTLMFPQKQKHLKKKNFSTKILAISQKVLFQTL